MKEENVNSKPYVLNKVDMNLRKGRKTNEHKKKTEICMALYCVTFKRCDNIYVCKYVIRPQNHINTCVYRCTNTFFSLPKLFF